MADQRPFTHLVLVGSSAGGIEALSELVSTLPEDFPAPIAVAQHLDPNRESRLREVLEYKSTLPVQTLEEENSLPLRPGVVYMVPVDRHVDITDSNIHPQDTHGRLKPSVDVIFEAAAARYEDRLIAVVLTGTGSDGAYGARVVKKAGGTVVIQDSGPGRGGRGRRDARGLVVIPPALRRRANSRAAGGVSTYTTAAHTVCRIGPSVASGRRGRG